MANFGTKSTPGTDPIPDPKAAIPPRRQLQSEQRRLERGLVHNFIGAQYMWGGIDFPQHAQAFFGPALREFDRAQRLLSDWYQPYENKGDTHRFLAMALEGQDRRRELLRALEEYRRALGYSKLLSDDTARLTVRRRLQIAVAMALLLIGDQELVREARHYRKQAEGEDETWALATADVPSVYNMGALLARLAQAEPEPTLRVSDQALWYLAIALLRNVHLVDAYSAIDPDVRTLPGLQELREGAIVTLGLKPELSREMPLSAGAVESILQRAGRSRIHPAEESRD